MHELFRTDGEVLTPDITHSLVWPGKEASAMGIRVLGTGIGSLWGSGCAITAAGAPSRGRATTRYDEIRQQRELSKEVRWGLLGFEVPEARRHGGEAGKKYAETKVSEDGLESSPGRAV